MYYKQKNITVTPEQVELIKANAGKMTIEKLATMLGLPIQKTYNNMKVLKLHKPRTKVIKIDSKYFDVDKFGKLYNY